MTGPKFRVDKRTKPPRLFVQCSAEGCEKDVCELKPHESILVTRAYFCPEHDDGVIVLNPAIRETNDKPNT